MSTYLQGATDTGFNPIQYTPNFSYMANALQKAQAKYDTNYNEIASNYDKLVNSLSNPQNNEYVNQFLENTKEQIKQLSSKDLSLKQNVDEAEKLFTPLWEDEDILADYKITKQYQSQIQEYNKLKNSDKKEDRDRAWDKGLQFVQLTLQNLKLAKRGDGSIQKIKVNEYVPNIDVHAEVNKYLNESGYKDGITSIKNENGRLVLVTNGPGSKETYSAVVDNFIKNRPDLQKIFMVEGVVDFQNMVNNERFNNPNITKEEAEQYAKKNYIATKTSEFESKINNYNSILKGTTNDDGLESKYIKLSTEISNDYDKGIEPTIEKLNEFKEYQTQISSINQQINKYKSVLKDLQSDDFNRPDVNLNGYFAEQYRHIFSENVALTRAAATTEKLINDSEAVAAMKMIAHQEDQNRKYGAIQEIVRTDNKGNVVITQKGYNENGSSSIPEDITFQSNENIQTNVKESASKISEKKADVPIVVNNKTTQEDLEKSFYINFNRNIQKNRDLFISGVAQYINTDSKLGSDFPSIYKYVDYLSSLINGTTALNKNIPSEENLKKTFNDLKNNENTKDYFKNFESYNSTPSLQLRSLLDYIDASTTNPSLERANLRPLIDDAASKFTMSNGIMLDFKEYNKKSKINPEFKTILKKDKKGNNRIINADDVVNLAETVYKLTDKELPWWEQGRNLGHYVLGDNVNERKGSLENAKILYNGKLPKDIAQAYVDGRLKVDEVYRKEYTTSDEGWDRINTKRYEYKDKDGGIWDLTDLVEKLNGLVPEKLKEKINKYNDVLFLDFNSFLEKKYPQYDRSFVLNKTLQYTNDPSTPKNENSKLIAQDAISNNQGNIIEKTDGVILPNNYNQLIKNQNRDDVNKVLEIILKNPTELDKVLSKTELSYSGKTSDKSLVKLIFDSDNLNNLIKKNFQLKPNSSEEKQLMGIAQSFVINGVELNVDNNVFLKYAKDDYMSSVITDEMLSKGIKASDYEKNKLHYDYTLTLGSNDQINVRYKVKKYDPTSNTFEWTEFEPQSYPKEIGVDNILRSLREGFMPNTQAIYNYLKQQSENKSTKLKNFKKKEGESSENHINRILNANNY